MKAVSDQLRERSTNGPGCWEWTGHVGLNGYGIISVNRDQMLAHRVAYALTKGTIPAGHVVRHKCDNRKCVKPDHLETGTRADNSRDMVERGRSTKGRIPASAKIGRSEVMAIREAYAKGGVLQEELAARYNLHPSQISRIVNGKKWAGVV